MGGSPFFLPGTVSCFGVLAVRSLMSGGSHISVMGWLLSGIASQDCRDGAGAFPGPLTLASRIVSAIAPEASHARPTTVTIHPVSGDPAKLSDYSTDKIVAI